MYIPPFWFHEVESLSNSISINVWYKSMQVTKMEQAWNENLPFQINWDENVLSLAVVALVSGVIERVKGKGTTRHTIKLLIDTRFRPLYGTEIHDIDLLKGVLTAKDPHLV